MRKGTGYRKRRAALTASVRIAIGERRKPDPDGRLELPDSGPRLA
ncbi:MAG: hypothetical protein ACREU9_00220 [Gammaproteobacteria bacterium]